MRRQLCRWLVLGGLLLGGAQLGCQSLPFTPPSPNSGLPQPLVPNLNVPASKAPDKDLPPDEAARVAFATAEELDKAGKTREAIALYEHARNLNPRYQKVCWRLAELQDRQGNYPQAQKEYAEALKRNPKDANLLNDIGYSHFCQGRWAEAENLLRQALTFNPKLERAWINLGMTLAQEQRYEEALEAFGNVVTPAEAHANLGFILTTQAKREEAKQEYRTALEMEPNLQVARTALFKLENPGADKAKEVAKEKGPRTDRNYVRPQNLLFPSPPPTILGAQGYAPTPGMVSAAGPPGAKAPPPPPVQMGASPAPVQ